ncbi:transposase [Nitrogeniibacter mangrovi]|uniref:Transposase n=1 Tax=Nitrogeniibacter mangrovi TaxID=2016596 RepID=A0A6C1B3A4_9RHOO|nr:transposase [Nitrogeniibacter mangrovi]QID18141.1 transposase [Nitrogeniibacter mangrovi]
MTYDALRRGRASLPGHAYHITIATAGRKPIFTDMTCARLAIDTLRQSDDAQRGKTIAWALMPDHLHWLLTLGETVSLARIVHRFKGRSARRINRHLKRSGTLWQRAYHDHTIREDEDLKSTARYIVANPLRAGLVERIGDYPHWDAAWI